VRNSAARGELGQGAWQVSGADQGRGQYAVLRAPAPAVGPFQPGSPCQTEKRLYMSNTRNCRDREEPIEPFTKCGCGFKSWEGPVPLLRNSRGISWYRAGAWRGHFLCWIRRWCCSFQRVEPHESMLSGVQINYPVRCFGGRMECFGASRTAGYRTVACRWGMEEVFWSPRVGTFARI